uniref:Uncharacterized protein n=1 Tax=Candidatus Kentrum sp. DK TaxID=2126562 RepID=A0A450ST35_9GAMM|nr:MAG: hypothetical protein BECKDK2373B_GA0170837_10649 [Candidatus Kentron sp. DK]
MEQSPQGRQLPKIRNRGLAKIHGEPDTMDGRALPLNFRKTLSAALQPNPNICAGVSSVEGEWHKIQT